MRGVVYLLIPFFYVHLARYSWEVIYDGTYTPESELEIYGREFEKRQGYARVAPLVTVATLGNLNEEKGNAQDYALSVLWSDSRGKILKQFGVYRVFIFLDESPQYWLSFE